MYYGYSPEDWQSAKREATKILSAYAAKADPFIAYSELTEKIEEATSIVFDYHGKPLDALLGEISKEEHEAGRGMLSVIVVHKAKDDRRPGNGFFEAAKILRLTVTDRDTFWQDQVKKVQESWAKKR